VNAYDSEYVGAMTAAGFNDWPLWAVLAARTVTRDELLAHVAAGWPWPAHEAPPAPRFTVRALTREELMA
jgi:hypothetical protein